VDPRGVFTFGVAGLAVICFSILMRTAAGMPRGLALLGYVTGALLVVVYVARLVILEATHPLVAGPAVLAGFLANPAWYAWLGATLHRSAGRARL
jgi:hypothetical protein